ncbi:MAG: NgoFVII family restriction endonuclease [Nitrospirae bacterium]|nr:NgoFVII family restriction endonuclease [Nitrospirota bacterium]
MIIDNLFDQVLVEPVKQGADHLFIVSGYATATMTSHHIETIKKNLRKQVHISLIVGMCPYDGLSLSNHKAFQQLASADYSSNFECSYIVQPPPVHSKSYAWFRGKTPVCGFVGSANYTQNAFSNNQREMLVHDDPIRGFAYFQSLVSDTIYCTHHEVENYVEVYRDTYYARRKKERLEREGLQLITSRRPDLQGLPGIRISLLDKKGGLPQRSGLNWGQRPEYRRDPNQAYIKLSSIVYKTDFFPPIAVRFTILTDDNKVLVCTRAQQNGKAIESPSNNSLIGEYFRYRLGVPSGNSVRKQDLINYGRSDVDFYKIDEETYFMDFSVSASGG